MDESVPLYSSNLSSHLLTPPHALIRGKPSLSCSKGTLFLSIISIPTLRLLFTISDEQRGENSSPDTVNFAVLWQECEGSGGESGSREEEGA